MAIPRGRYRGFYEKRLADLETTKVKCTWFEETNTYAGSTLSPPIGATVVLAQFGAGVDVIVSTVTSGSYPDFKNVRDAGGNIVTATLSGTGNLTYAFSSTPVDAQVALIYVYKVNLSDLDADFYFGEAYIDFYDSAFVAITGGSINGTIIGGSTPADGDFTKVVVDNITIDGVVISSDTGDISFADDNLTTTGYASAATFRASDGTALLPSHTFIGDLDTGGYLVAANKYGIAAGGNKVFAITSVGEGRFFRAGGNALAPRFQFRKSRGTVAIPTEVGDSDGVLILVAQAYINDAYRSVGQIVFGMDDTVSPTAYGSEIFIQNVLAGTTGLNTAIYINNAGTIEMGEGAGTNKLTVSVTGDLGFNGSAEVITNMPFADQKFLVFDEVSGNGIKVDTTTPTFGWGDLLGRVTSVNTGATKPAHTVYRDGLFEFKFSAGDEDYFEFHIPHDYVKGTDIFLHIHWSHIGTFVNGGTVTFNAEQSYCKAHNQAAFPASVNGDFTGTPSSTQYQQILSETQLSASSPTGLQIDTDDLEPDGVIIMTLQMKTNGLTVSEGAVPDPFIHYVDIHYQTTGLIGTKQKAPDFYGDLV